MNGHINAALIILDRVLDDIDSRFVHCEVCGNQDTVKGLGFTDDLKAVKSELLSMVVIEERREQETKT